jgi:hypothetical protein
MLNFINLAYVISPGHIDEQDRVQTMIARNNTLMEKAVKHAALLSRFKQYQLARKVLKNAGAGQWTIERVLYEPHNIRDSD